MRTTKLALCLAAILMVLPNAAQAMLQISKHATRNMDCSGGVCTPTAQDAVLNVDDLTAMLAAGDLKVVAGGEAVNIKVVAPFSWAGRRMLTLSAYQSVLVNAAITAAGRGRLTVSTNTSGTGGDFELSDAGTVTFWDLRSRFILNGKAYKLVGDIASLAADMAANPSGLFALAKDYDAHADGPYARSPITTVFTGRFTGLGHTVSNLSILNDNLTDVQIGLFYELGVASTTADIKLDNLAVQLDSHSQATQLVGGLAGVNRGAVSHVNVAGTFKGGIALAIGGVFGANYGTASFVRSEVVISGFNYGNGGIVFQNSGALMSCTAVVTISGSYGNGGIADQSDGSISSCSSSGSISAPDTPGASGGLVAAVNGGSVTNSYSTVSVTLSGDYEIVGGGLVGVLSGGEVAESFATGAVTNTGSARGERPVAQRGRRFSRNMNLSLGGLVGQSYGQVQNSYSTGSVTGVYTRKGHLSAVGGLIGFQTTLSNPACASNYSTSVTEANRGYLGGVIGFDNDPPGTNSSSYWDLDSGGVTDPSRGAGNVAYDPGLKGATDAQLHRLPKTFDPNVWAINPNINNGYPYLIANPPPR